jgi:uncharacterized protein YneF (UPF0154 family)
MLDGWFLWFILFWVVFLAGMLGIGGFFFLRKFLKSLTKRGWKIGPGLGRLLHTANKAPMGFKAERAFRRPCRTCA